MGDWILGHDGRWSYDEKAPSAAQQPATTMLPMVSPTARELDALHGDDDTGGNWFDTGTRGDVGDWIDPNAPDPTPDEITDRDHPDYVDPWFGER